MDTPLTSARQARKGLEKVRRELLDPTPRSLDRCSLPLQVAIACMTELASHLDNRAMNACGVEPLRAELLGLRRDLEKADALLQNAAFFYQGYGRLLRPGTSEFTEDYSPAARLASLRSERNFVLHG